MHYTSDSVRLPMREESFVADWAIRTWNDSDHVRIGQGVCTARDQGNGGCLLADVREHAIFALDQDWRIVSCNAGVGALLGYTIEEFVGQSLPRLFALHEETVLHLREQLEQSSVGSAVTHEHWVRRKDGTSFYARWSISVCGSESRSGACFVVFLSDATGAKEQRDAQRWLSASERRAREKAERERDGMRRILSILSHELRTPLQALRGWAQLLDTTAEPELKRRGLSAIRRNADALAQIANDLLDYERARTGKLTVQRILLDPRKICLRAIDAVEPMARERDLQLEIRIEPHLPQIEGDALRLEQVLWNLLSNAVKFTPPGGRISFETRARAQWVRFIVSDTGCGIAPDRMPHLFGLHYQTGNGADRQGGLGLGLPLVREIVAQHEGRIRATSAGEGRGSRFIVDLPRARRKTKDERCRGESHLRRIEGRLTMPSVPLGG